MDGKNSAFPMVFQQGNITNAIPGMSIRTWLAGKAMAAILTGTSGNLEMFAKMAGFSAEEGDDTVSDTVAQLAVEYADALLAALNEKGGE